MRILLAAEWVRMPGFEGAAAHHAGFVQALAGLGHEVHVLAQCEEGSEGKISYHPAPKIGFRPLLSYKSQPVIEKICRENSIEVIHKRMDPGSGFSVNVARKLGIPLAAEVNFNPFSFEKRGDVALDMVKPAVESLPRDLWARAFLGRADAIGCVSRCAADALLRHGVGASLLGVGGAGAASGQEGRMRVIPNGVDAGRFVGKFDAKAIAKKHGIAKPVALIVGGLGPRHGLEMIIRAAGKMPLMQFLVIGGVDRYADYVERMRAIAPKNVIFAGRVGHHQLPAYLSLADICMAPYEEALNPAEPFGFCPIKVLEYFGAGKPVVASDLPWLREIVEDGKGGILFSGQDGFESALARLLGDGGERKRMGGYNKKQAREKYSWGSVARRYLNL